VLEGKVDMLKQINHRTRFYILYSPCLSFILLIIPSSGLDESVAMHHFGIRLDGTSRAEGGGEESGYINKHHRQKGAIGFFSFVFSGSGGGIFILQ